MSRAKRDSHEHPQWTCDFEIRPSIAEEVSDDTGADSKKKDQVQDLDRGDPLLF